MNRKFYVTLLSIINVIRSFLLVGQAIISKELIDEAVKVIESKSSDKLVVIGIIFCVAIILNIALSLIYFQIKNKFSLRIEVDLKKKIYDLIIKEEINFNNLIITNQRQLKEIENAKLVLEEILNAKGEMLEILAMLIKKLWTVLGKITGNTENENIIDLIFSKFCLGK